MHGQEIDLLKIIPGTFIVNSLGNSKSMAASFVVAINPYGFNVGDPQLFLLGVGRLPRRAQPRSGLNKLRLTISCSTHFGVGSHQRLL